MENQFTSVQLAGDPWSHVDVVVRAGFLKTVTAAFEILKAVPAIGVSTMSRSYSVSSSAVRKLNWAAGKAQKLAHFGDITASKVSKTVQKLRQRSFKD